jgi:hypothetical protein
MNLHVTIGAIGVLRVQIVLRPSGLNGADIMRRAVARETKLRYPAGYQQPWISRTVRRVTRHAAFGF